MSRQRSTLTTARRFVALGGGLMLLLAPRDGRLLLETPLREIYILAITLFVSAVLLLLFKSYEPLGASMVTVMALSGVELLRNAGVQLYDSILAKAPFDFKFSYYDIVCWGVVWLIPFLICILIRLLARNEWDTPERRANFCRFFRATAASFFFYFTILFVLCFFFIPNVDSGGARQYNLVPFAQIEAYLGSMEHGLRYLLGNLLFFTPIGFFLAVYRPKWRWWQHLLIGTLFSGAIELLQFAFHCGMADVDDVILNVLGLLIGVGVKLLLDRLRAMVTDQEELSIRYTQTRQPAAQPEET